MQLKKKASKCDVFVKFKFNIILLYRYIVIYEKQFWTETATDYQIINQYITKYIS